MMKSIKLADPVNKRSESYNISILLLIIKSVIVDYSK